MHITHIKSLIMVLAVGLVSFASHAAQNIAYQDADTRFTVVADGVVRMEWHPEGRFLDSPSLLASERDYPATDYRVDDRRGKVTITTPRMTVTYTKGSGAFSRDNLRIRSAKGMHPAFDWRPGDSQKGNLKGTTRTLDGLEGDMQTQTWVSDMKKGERRSLDDGILATDGWTFIDDSDGYIFDNGGEDGWNWVAERDSARSQDWYFMAYGHDYKQALRDFTLFAGKVPLPPRYAFGYWWSRYWAYSDTELRGLADKFDAYGIPLDVLVVDMDWHYTDPGRGGWTGWTWNRSLFPSPEAFMDHMHSRGIKTTINLHPADGVEAYEEPYGRLAAQLGIADSSKIEWIGSDKAVMKAMFDGMLHPMERSGVDFWWLDWQQHLKDPRLKNLDNTWWINYCFFSDMERAGMRRPLLYHRWGGLGNHRYQVGFSGDATISWASLEYQPYFTSTASNVLYGYWSHDIGGHLGNGKPIDPEMYTRWLQFGAVSPIMRTHSSKDSKLNKEPWVFDDQYRDIIRETVRQRYRMLPYIYSMARKTHEEGVSLCRPMYYDYPEADEAYAFKAQYMFGDNMLIAPVTSPAGVNGYAAVSVWLPDGEWFETATGTLLEGGRTLTRHFAPDEYGIYVRAASILPMYADGVMRLDRNDEPVELHVYPGGGENSFSIYEDAGDSPDYSTAYATTSVRSQRSDSSLNVVMEPRSGSYEGMPASRDYTLRAIASGTPARVLVDGKDAEWSYDGRDFAVVVRMPDVDCTTRHEISMDFNIPGCELADGLAGRARRMAAAIEYIKFHGCDTHADELASAGTLREAVGAAPEKLDVYTGRFNAIVGDIHGVLERQGMAPDVRRAFLQRAGLE